MQQFQEKKSSEDLRSEIDELKRQLAETEETLNAIRSGDVDAIIVSGKNGEKVFSLSSSETPYRIIIENMDEGAITITSSGVILYCNSRFADIIEVPQEKVPSTDLSNYITEKDLMNLKDLLHKGMSESVRGEFTLKKTPKTVRLSLSPLPKNIEGDICIVVSDITALSNYQKYLVDMVDERTVDLRIANMRLYEDLEKIKNTEKALKDSEKLFRSAFDDGAAPMTLTSKEGKFIKVNQAFCRLTGFSQEELLQKTLMDITYNEDLEVSLTGRNELLTEGKSTVGLEKRYVRKDGKIIWVYVNKSPVIDEDGEWDFFVTQVQNINKRKIAETRLKESKERFRQLANSIPQLAWIARSDGYIYWFNQRWFEYTGKMPEEMLGWDWLSLVKNDGNTRLLKKWKTLIEKREPFEMVNLILGKDGVYREFLTRSIPMPGGRGKADQWFGTHTDISEIKKVEKELLKYRERLNLALENGQIGIWEWDIRNNTVIWDKRTEKMFGYKPGTFDGTYESFEASVHEEDLAHLRNALNNSLRTHKALETVFRIKIKNGKHRFISTKALINMNSKGDPASMSGICFDITGMKQGVEEALLRLNEELLRSNTDLQQFAYVASHDLQEPLRMVSSFTQLLQLKYSDKIDDDGREFIHYAVEGSKRMYELLNGLLAYSRVQSRGTEFAKVDMNRVVEKVMDNLSLKISETETKIISQRLPEVFADENQMIQLIQNLFENSIKFRRQKPEITVSSETRDDHYIFRITDNGIGIESQYFERIFRIFQRLHRTDEYTGTGIGLAICKRIVGRHMGTIWTESEPGKGSTFSFSIPVASPNAFSL